MKWIKALAALSALLGVSIGPPILLTRFVGNPLPDATNLSGPLTDSTLIGLLALVVWALWAQTLWCITTEVVAAFRSATLRPAPGVFGFQAQLTRSAIALIAAAIAAAPMTPQSARADTTAPVATSPHATATLNVDDIEVTPPAAEQAAASAETVASPTSRVVTVARGDTLWALAEQHLDAGERWTQIADLNDGSVMNDGSIFDATGILRPGWEIQLPAATIADHPVSADVTGHEVEVEPGDTLSQIALDHLGDPTRYPEIFDASVELDQPIPLTDPDLIHPGQRLVIPAGPPVAPTHGDLPVLPDAEEPVEPPAPTTEHTDQRDAEPVDTIELAAAEDAHSDGVPSWAMIGLTSGGWLLSAALLLALHRRRSTQKRYRHPGFVPVPPPVQATVAEKTMRLAPPNAATTTERLDTALRRLATTLAAARQNAPLLNAVEVSADTITLHLTEPADPPAPWSTGSDRRSWTIGHDAVPDLGRQASSNGRRPHPWPLLVTLGVDQLGSTWLLNLEGQDIAVTGDPTSTHDFARHVTADLACSPWSTAASVDTIGVAAEVTDIDPDRVRHHTTAGPVTTDVIAHATLTLERLTDLGEPDPATARTTGTDTDPWTARALIADQHQSHRALTDLADLLRTTTTRTAAALVTVGESSPMSRQLVLTDDGALVVPDLDLRVTPVSLTAGEAEACAQLLAHADTTDDQAPAPALERDEPWAQFATTTGSLREQHRSPRDTHERTGNSSSVLPRPDRDYTSTAATTRTDLADLAPRVTPQVALEVKAADPTLDADLADWRDPQSPRPKLALLGPVHAHTSGASLAKRRAYYTELFAFLLTRDHAATTDQVAAALDVSTERTHTDLNVLRGWLGNDPSTGEKFLPNARSSSSARERGIGLYEIPAALSDLDLFRRLRLRGETRGPDGITDLTAALALVTGRPFDQLRPAGWTWLFEGDRLDIHAAVAIADVAHLVVTSALADGDIPGARTAVDLGLTAAPDEEILRLDLAAVLTAEGHDTEAERVVRDEVCNRSDDHLAPTDLPTRSNEVITQRGWVRRQAG